MSKKADSVRIQFLEVRHQQIQLDLVAKDNYIADLNAKIQLLEQDLKRTQERYVKTEAQLYEADRLAARRFRSLRAITEVAEAAQ